ncbi:uncharacterized protein LOC108680231 [Hyalella azteca]|uniref:Uncharacterized protein LOC108680231 n=1 Tax=Hyalella azteca TaxID=294128 RepID=A0A8B7PEH0_HYAAZ|nr:uncharacterized protein LOC108680231 [Hyalella azteca]
MTKIKISGDQKPRADEAKIVIVSPAETADKRTTMTVQMRSLMTKYSTIMFAFSWLMLLLLMVITITYSGIFNYIQIKVYINKYFNVSQPQNSTQQTSLMTETRRIPYALSDEFIQYVNDKTDSWEAGRNFPTSTSMRVLRRMMGVKEESQFQGSSSANKLPLKVASGNISDLGRLKLRADVTGLTGSDSL